MKFEGRKRKANINILRTRHLRLDFYEQTEMFNNSIEHANLFIFLFSNRYLFLIHTKVNAKYKRSILLFILYRNKKKSFLKCSMEFKEKSVSFLYFFFLLIRYRRERKWIYTKKRIRENSPISFSTFISYDVGRKKIHTF